MTDLSQLIADLCAGFDERAPPGFRFSGNGFRWENRQSIDRKRSFRSFQSFRYETDNSKSTLLAISKTSDFRLPRMRARVPMFWTGNTGKTGNGGKVPSSRRPFLFPVKDSEPESRKARMPLRVRSRPLSTPSRSRPPTSAPAWPVTCAPWPRTAARGRMRCGTPSPSRRGRSGTPRRWPSGRSTPGSVTHAAVRSTTPGRWSRSSTRAARRCTFTVGNATRRTARGRPRSSTAS